MRYAFGHGGRLCRLNLRTGKLQVLLDDPAGGIRDPDVHYDGRKILFSYRRAGTTTYHLYEIDSDGTNLRQLTDGPDNDLEPIYTPDGGIVFCSSRCHRFVPCWRTQVATLYRCDADGETSACCRTTPSRRIRRGCCPMDVQSRPGRRRPEQRRQSAARAIGSSASRLMTLIDGSHYEARLSDRERMFVRLWIESGAVYPGTYGAVGQRHLPGEVPRGDPAAALCRMPPGNQTAVPQPEERRLLFPVRQTRAAATAADGHLRHHPDPAPGLFPVGRSTVVPGVVQS